MEIRPGKTAPCELVNVAGEVITEGTHNHCSTIMNAIVEEFDEMLAGKFIKVEINGTFKMISKGEEHA
tara:strand:- start:78 stop:281 length:204 start_codon:yes stop_codon:yes gene_type:complete